MKRVKTLLFLITVLTGPVFTGCIDDSPVKYNTYGISAITPPVDRQGVANEKRVHIGHDLPVNITLTATYDEADVPVQIYLLNVDDVGEVENGIGYVSDIRMYYCERTPNTTINQLRAGTNTYGLVINIPAEDSRDKLTGDFKTGTYYVVGEVNKNEDAEIDAYMVYQKFKDRLDEENKIVITADYMKNPDLSVESMSFTGGADNPEDVLVWYNVSLADLPGISNSSLTPDEMLIIVEPSEKDRNFTGTIHVKSSASDALNVPLVFYLKDEAETIDIQLEIYDQTMGGWVDEYYIPILKANTTERITLGLRIPEDSGPLNYFSNWDEDVWGAESNKSDYPLSQIRYAMGKEEYGDHPFKIVAKINPGGQITESRFIKANDSNDAYSESDYYEGGDEYSASKPAPAITSDNNTMSESLTFTLEKVDVSPNEGIKTYPYVKMDPKDPDYRSIVIFWDGLEFNVGGDMFGANAEAHEGMFFYNYSLYSLGIHVSGTVFKNTMFLVNTFLNAESHPYNEIESGFEFHIEGFNKVILSEAGQGFSNNRWEYPILIWGAEKSIVKWFYCFKFTLTGGIETWFTPGLNLDVNNDGSLVVDKTAELRGSAYADASASIAGLASVGLYTYLDVLTLNLIQSSYTTTEYDSVNYPGRVKGRLNREVGLYLTGPKGYIDLYFEIDFVFFSKRWSKQIYSYSSFTIPLLEMDFLTSVETSDYENLTSTNWMRVEDTNLLPLDTSNSE